MADEDELILRSKQPKPTKPRRQVSDGSTVRVEQAFKSAFEQRWGFPLICNPGRDRKLLKGLIGQWGEAETAVLIPLFFATTDPEIRRCRFYNIPDFAYWSLKLRRIHGNGAGLQGRTAENVHEIAKAMGKE